MVLRKQNLLTACLLIIVLIFFSPSTRAEDSRRTFFKVGNLSCGVCLGKIDAKLKTFDGYISMLASFDKGLIAVDHRQNLTDGEISEAITSIGYPATVASESDYDQHSSASSESPGWRSPSDGFLSRILGVFSR